MLRKRENKLYIQIHLDLINLHRVLWIVEEIINGGVE